MSITLAAKSLLLTFSEQNGALISMKSNITGWVIQRRASLGLSWRMLVPIDDEHRDNQVLGEKQKLTSYTGTRDSVTFVWDNIVSEKAGTLPIKVTVTVKAEGNQAVWYMSVENNSPHTVEYVYSPYIGDLTRPDDCEWFKTFIYSYGSADEWNLWPSFDQHEGCHSVDYPTQFGAWSASCGNPASPFFLLRSGSEGLYAGVKSSCVELVAWHCELRPGYITAMDSLVPEEDNIAGKPVHTLFAPVHMCYIMPGESRELTPIALEAFKGGWQSGADIYKSFRDSWAKTASAPEWARDVHSWLQLHINSPEDELRTRFTELPRIARECIRYGIKAIQLVGWNDGGQDQNNPSHDPDPRLGTFEELKQAIKDCRETGIKIILFAKFTWADRATERFRKELIYDSIRDPYGDYYHFQGYEYQTATQLLDINTKRLIPMCFGSPHYMEVCRNEFKKLVGLGCDGFLFDECLHHSPALLCFDTSHGHRYGWPVYSNDREFIYMLQNTPGLDPDFLFAGEACYDYEMEAYSLSYFRSWSRGHIPLSRYLRQSSQFMTAVTGFNDRNMINQCLMFRYIISYEPYNFKGMPGDYPDTVRYGNKMDNLRREYRKYFWDGEFRGKCGAFVAYEDGKEHAYYSVFDADDGTAGIVICNYENHDITVKAAAVKCRLKFCRTVDESVMNDFSGAVNIPPRSAVIII